MSMKNSEITTLQIYLSKDELKQFKIVSAHNNKSMSKFLRQMIQNEIKKFQDKLK